MDFYLHLVQLLVLVLVLVLALVELVYIQVVDSVLFVELLVLYFVAGASILEVEAPYFPVRALQLLCFQLLLDLLVHLDSYLFEDYLDYWKVEVG